jgi:ribosome-binding protein aMBF1 (putative translation factor)
MKAKPHADLRRRSIPGGRVRVNDREAARIALEQLTLRELRKACGLSQEEVAERLEKSQAQISRFERSGDMMLGSLRALVEALGCELRLQVRRRDDGEWVELCTTSEDSTAG